VSTLQQHTADAPDLSRWNRKIGGSRFDSTDDSVLDDLADADPATLGRYMRRMSSEMGEDMGEEFNEVVERLEHGEDPESIESSMQLPDAAPAADSAFDD